jgi:hypothetical protein
MVWHANSKPAMRTPLDPGLRRELMARFRPKLRTAVCAQRDLVSQWGYSQPESSGTAGLLE